MTKDDWKIYLDSLILIGETLYVNVSAYKQTGIKYIEQTITVVWERSKIYLNINLRTTIN